MKEFFKYEKLRSTTELNWCNTVKYFHFEKKTNPYFIIQRMMCLK